MVRVGDLVLFGQGSEWLWSLAQFVVVAVTAIAIFRQLAAQRSADLVEHATQWDHEWEGTPMIRSKLALMLAVRGRSPEQGLPYVADEIPDLFERLGYLVHSRHIRALDFWNDGAWSVVEFYWWLLRPYIEHDRGALPGEVSYHWFEWLETEMRRLDDAHGQQRPPYDEAQRVAIIDRRTGLFREKLAREQPGWGLAE